MSSQVLLLGQGIGYSASPAMQNAAFDHLGMPITYGLCDVEPSALAEAVQRLRDDGAVGANVTTPHKVAVLDLVDEVDASAARAGAANVIVRRDGRLIAHSTDLPAIAADLHQFSFGATGQALVLGAGGAAQAVAASLVDAGWQDIRLLTRGAWSELSARLDAADLLVNATPIGTGSDVSPVPARSLRADLPVLDLVYRPSPTRLVRDARTAGAQARAGAGVLLEQAALSFTLWTNRAAPVSVMRSALQSELGSGADV
jgi:shikimate dehydrogenase